MNNNILLLAADIECAIEKTCESEEPPSKKARKSGKGEKKTAREAEHKPYVLAYKVNSHILKYDRPVKCIYGKDCVEEFVKELDLVYEELKDVLTKNTSPVMPDADTLAKMKAVSNCCICEEPMALDEKKDLDHDHQTGEVYGYAHTS